VGLFVEYTFGRTLIFSKMRSASQTWAISRKYGIAPNQFFLVLQYCPPLFPNPVISGWWDNQSRFVTLYKKK
jgi:hypothetical protein